MFVGLTSAIGMVCHAASLRELRSAATSLVLGPLDTEWPLVNPLEEPFYGKAAVAAPPAGYWSENRPISRSKTGRAWDRGPCRGYCRPQNRKAIANLTIGAEQPNAYQKEYSPKYNID